MSLRKARQHCYYAALFMLILWRLQEVFDRVPRISFLITAFFLANVSLSQAQAAGGVQAGESRFRVVRSVSGTRGSQQGSRYVIEDPRTVFYVPDDKQVIVYFEWEGPVGEHHFEAYWKNPEGKTVVISDFKFASRDKRFGGYWSLNLSDTMPTGLWSLEAHVDGEVTGSHSFQIVAAAKPAEAAPSGPQLLTPSQIYQKALASTVTLQKVSSAGERLGNGSGFVIANGLIATTFRAIDGAGSIHVVLPGGKQFLVSDVVGWDRWQDWAILRVPTADIAALKRAKPNSWSVGDRCFFLDVAENGSRTIVDLNVTGTNTYPSAGERLSLGSTASADATGSPLLNEYGELIAIVGAGTIPGSSSLGTRFGFYGTALPGKENLGSLALPISLVPEPKSDINPTAFSELAQRGQFIPPLVGSELVAQGSLALSIDKRRNVTPMPLNQKYQFSHKDQHMAVFVMWNAKQKQKTVSLLRIYNLNNQLLMESKPSKLSLNPSSLFSSTDWQIEIDRMPPAIYRLDVLVADQPVWRTFFSVTD